MNDKKYLDKVLDYIVSRTKIDYGKGLISFPFTTQTTHQTNLFLLTAYELHFSLPFVKYCNRQFGLTNDEVEYVYRRYLEIIVDKIKNGQ